MHDVDFAKDEDVGEGLAGHPGLIESNRVLLVEDDLAIRETISDLLEAEGFFVLAAANGQDALQILRSQPCPAVILLDLSMPVMDGWDFRQAQLRDAGLRDIPTMVLTAAGFSRETIRTQFGDVDFVRKPVAPDELVAAVNRACRRDLASAMSAVAKRRDAGVRAAPACPGG